MEEFDARQINIAISCEVPLNQFSNYPTSIALIENDFAYPTIKDRLPVILTRVIDTIHQTKTDVVAKYGQAGLDDIKEIIGLLSKLRNEVQTNKPLLPINDSGEDTAQWNEYLIKDCQLQGEESKWFLSSWLYTECYFYRRINEAIRQSELLKSYDPFHVQKCQALVTSLPAVASLVKYQRSQVEQVLTDSKQASVAFADFLQISLWGNKCDLSISSGRENSQKVDAHSSLSSLKDNLLINHTDSVWSCLVASGNADAHVHIILDNAGFELITDLVLADFLVSTHLVERVTLHGKAMPWFVSDVTIDDLRWTLGELKASKEEVLAKCGHRWSDYLESGFWTYKSSSFWTLPHGFKTLEEVDVNLFNELGSADLLIFKGDLNYRKLLGDLKWPYSTAFKSALQGFLPSPLVALRTLKSDLIVGIKEELASTTENKDEEWLINGRWGVIQFAK